MKTNSVTHDRLLQLLEELLQHQIDGGQQGPRHIIWAHLSILLNSILVLWCQAQCLKSTTSRDW